MPLTKAQALDKVRKLVELASAHAPDEATLNAARNAGLQACRLIKLHGLAVGVAVADAAAEAVVEELHRVAPESPIPRPPRAPRQPRQTHQRSDITDAVVDAAGRVGKRVARNAVDSALNQLFGGRR